MMEEFTHEDWEQYYQLRLSQTKHLWFAIGFASGIITALLVELIFINI